MVTIVHARIEDAEEILSLQKLAYQSEALLYNKSRKTSAGSELI